MCSQLGVSRVVVGHTVMDKVEVLCGGELIMADVGLSRAILGKAGHVVGLECKGPSPQTMAAGEQECSWRCGGPGGAGELRVWSTAGEGSVPTARVAALAHVPGEEAVTV